MPSSPEPDRTQRLADVYARAERLRRQRRARLGTGALLGSLAVFMVGLLVGSSLGIPQQLTTIGRPDASSTTTTEPPTTTTTTGLPAEPGPEAPRSNPAPDGVAAVQPPPPDAPTLRPPATTTPTTEPPTTTSTTVSCRNSRDPACGPFRYDPPLVNEPMTIEVTFSPRSPDPGDEVTFTVRVKDDGPAAAGDDCINAQTFGDEETTSKCVEDCTQSEPRHGPWDPPAPEDTSFEETFRHTYAERGIYTATFSYNQGANCLENPYYSPGKASITLTVR